ncbi:hypothetical protein MH117_05250 [Paenibacillus sp. ACRRX]|nr:hypothetical protein [Paenibacillus sp. ACRRX]
MLVLAHRGELLDQAADKLEKSTGLKCAGEKAEQTSVGSWFRVVVGSVQTLMRDKRLLQIILTRSSSTRHIIVYRLAISECCSISRRQMY